MRTTHHTAMSRQQQHPLNPHRTLPFVRVGTAPTARVPRQAPMMAPHQPAQQQQQHRGGLARRSFAHPPLNPQGDLCDASDRPLLCMSVSKDEEEMVVGSADHALYAYNIRTGKPTRKLYTKTHGHIDWVSSVVHMDDGQVLSGGADGKVCLWPAAHSSSSSSVLGAARPALGTTACQDLDGHASAVTKLLPVPDSHMAFSGGYDGKIKLWNLAKKRALTFVAGGAGGKDDAAKESAPIGSLDPVMDFCFDTEKEQLVSGTRKGTCNVWDLKTANHVGALNAAHKGPVTCVLRWSASVIVTGGQDGVVKIHDTRRGMPLCAHAVVCHSSAAHKTTGAVACLEKVGGLLATGGGDNRVCVLDPRVNFQSVMAFEYHRDAVSSLRYALAAESPVLFSGAGDGMVHCYNLLSGTLLYGLHVNQGTVRALVTTTGADKKLLVAGDDGKALMYTF